MLPSRFPCPFKRDSGAPKWLRDDGVKEGKKVNPEAPGRSSLQVTGCQAQR